MAESKAVANSTLSVLHSTLNVSLSHSSAICSEVRSGFHAEAYITLHNNSSVTVDRIDFYVRCFDAYGNQIKGYGIYDVSCCFYDEIIKAGKSSPSDIYWGLYGFNGTKRIEVAVFSYHTLSGTTVEIPEDQIFWKSFK